MLVPLPLPVHDRAAERLIPADAPARPRALAVLDGLLSGRAWADDASRPAAVLVLEDADGTVFGGGELTRRIVAATLSGVETRSGDLIFGFAGGDDPMRHAVPGRPYWGGEAIDFTERRPPPDEARADRGIGASRRPARAHRCDAPRTHRVVRGHDPRVRLGGPLAPARDRLGAADG